MNDELKSQILLDFYAEAPPPTGLCMLAFRGSIAHGMYTGDLATDWNGIDDIDLMGVVVGRPRHYLGLYKWGDKEFNVKKECLEIKQGRWDNLYYEMKKFAGLLIKGNPNTITMLWLKPDAYLELRPAGQSLIDNRHLFLSRHIYNAFGAYAKDQLAKMESRDPAELRDYLALTYEAKVRGIHPTTKGEVFDYPMDYDQDSGEARNAKAHSKDVLLSRLQHYMRKGDNLAHKEC